MNDQKSVARWPHLANVAPNTDDMRQTCQELYAALASSVPLLLESLADAKRQEGGATSGRHAELLEALNSAQQVLARAKRTLRGSTPVR